MAVRHDYFPAFDVFRGVGILFVILAHSTGESHTLDAFRPIGILGVHMFFALSGFLITHRLMEEEEQTGTIRLTQFYRRRARRILPPAAIYLAVLATLGPILHKLPSSWSEIAACLFFYRNLYQPPMPSAWYTAHFWSLSLEEQFYLVWPALLVVLGVRTLRVKAVGFGLIAASAVWRLYASTSNIYRTDLLVDHLLWGCMIALCWEEIRRRTTPAIRTIAGIAGIVAATTLLYKHPSKWQAAFAFAVALGFIFSADAVDHWARGRTWLIKFGQASYDCYLWQSLFLPLPFAAAGVALVQRAPMNYAFIALLTAISFRLTMPKRNETSTSSTLHFP